MTTCTNGGSQASATYYAIKDHQNTVIALTDDTGSVVESYEYDAYGNTQIFDATGAELTESAYGNRYCFQGREYDSSTGLYYFRARWYDSNTGRWLSKDLIGIEGGLNQYEFCENNPVMFVDPYGLSWGFWGAVAGIVAAPLIVAGVLASSAALLAAGVAAAAALAAAAAIMDSKSAADKADGVKQDIDKIKNRQEELDEIAEGEGFDLYDW